MKLFKKIDFFVQWILLVGGVLYSILMRHDFSKILFSYFILGGWQLLSFIVHGWVGKAWMQHKDRIEYGKTIFWLFIIGVVCYLLALAGIPLVFVYLVGMLIASPFAAIWYLYICRQELSMMRNRALIHLK